MQYINITILLRPQTGTEMSDTNSDHIQFDQTYQPNLETSAEDEIVSPAPPPWQLIDLQDCLHDSPQFRYNYTSKYYYI